MSAFAGGRIDHVMLPVAELERSLAFYALVFGMVVIRRRDARQGRPQAAHIGYDGGSAQATIELIEASPPMEPPSKSGAGHICIHLPDMAAFRETIRAHGILAEGVSSLAPEGDRIWIRDPDGHMLEIVSRPG